MSPTPSDEQPGSEVVSIVDVVVDVEVLVVFVELLIVLARLSSFGKVSKQKPRMEASTKRNDVTA